jgi:hypothetical protein
MKTPPLLLGATLLFWGWQTGLLIPAVVMAVILEGARWIKSRWEFSNEDFTRIWIFCSVALLAAAVYAFSSTERHSDIHGIFESSNVAPEHSAGTASARAAMTIVRWLPMIFFLFVTAQTYSVRESVPLETVSQILRYRWKGPRRLRPPDWKDASVNMSYPFLILCLFSASAHTGDDGRFFWGFCGLVAWALWPLRSPRFGRPTWGVALLVAIALGYVGQNGMGRLQSYLSNLNPEWLASFSRRRFDPSRSRTELGRIGRVQTSGKIVIRLEVKNGRVPSLLREASYPSYKQQTWFAGMSESDFQRVSDYATPGTFALFQDNTNPPNKVSIGCYLDGGRALLPLPEGTARLEHLMAYDLEKSDFGAVLVQGPGLVIFDAFYGPGSTLDTPPNTNSDLVIPPRELPAIEQIASELRLDERPRDQVLKTLGAFFQERFAYSTWQDATWPPVTEETPLARFLLHTHKGHCEYFATAGALLLRRAGIPTRYAVGYAVHEKSGGGYVVRQRDAHAWCLVWDNEHQAWRDFDPTPVSWFAVEANRGSTWQWVSDAWSRIVFELSKFRWGQGHLRKYLFLATAPVLVILLYQIIFQRWRRNRTASLDGADAARAWPGLDSEFFAVEASLVERGFIRQPSETLSEWLQRAALNPELVDVSASLRELLRLHYRLRFDPRGLSQLERETLRHQVTHCLTKIQQMSTSPSLS